jgi:hypothetical protein
MKSISSLAVVGLLLFACKLCSFTAGNKNTAPSPTPRPLVYAADFLKPKIGSFTLFKRRARDELLKDASSDANLRNMLERSNDAGVASYKSEKEEPAIFCVFSFRSPDGATSELDQFEKDIRGTYRWRNITSRIIEHGKRLEATDSKSRTAVMWTNGYWLFWVWSGDPALTNSFANSVGY